ncbi:DUF4198 domain-containing protein [Anaeromyxobacter oryzisoli]|uniref:DUF4198 domain-containing protein n=1 Tax=Anaeromyxobacter oryzisoli TaxID=2925408 RepID=UPI001F595F5F|nr:DUF4198 domain-containing protein [Anaeromyxobacter sp. SG63]
MNKILAVAALVAAPALATAHDLWVERTPGGFLVRSGHRGAEALTVDAAKVKAIRCLDAGGAQRDVLQAARFAPREVRVAASCAAVSVFHDGGYWSLTPDGEVNLPKNQAQSVVRSWASRQYAKWVDAKSPRAGAVLGDELELVPVTELGRARAGDKITLRVLSAGRPVPDAVVAIGHRLIGDTDSKGEIRLRVRRAGVESISTSIRRTRATPEADAEVLEASLTFEVAK